MRIPIVTIVGRPNSGKSSLFNRILGARIAITSPEEGTTRDRLFQRVEDPDLDFFLVDTSGLKVGKGETNIENDMRLQAELAIEEADLILFVVEAKNPLTTQDLHVAQLLRKVAGKKSIFLVANKCDQPLNEGELADLYQLGLGNPLQISALHKWGIKELKKEMIRTLKKRHFTTKESSLYEVQEKSPLIALVGKPNTGKSSLINALCKENRAIVSDVPGTTRDATDTFIHHQGKIYHFIDTAGLRRKSKRDKGIEYFSMLRAFAAIERSDIALLVLDASGPVTDQDQQIAREIIQAGKGLILLANKWDLKKGTEKEEVRRNLYILELQRHFAFTSWAPVIFTSAVTKENLNHIFEQIEEVQKERERQIKTGPLNSFVRKITAEHKLTGTKRIPPKIFYLTQVGTQPPAFKVFVNKKNYFHFSSMRYIENRMREHFGFRGTPLQFFYQDRGENRQKTLV